MLKCTKRFLFCKFIRHNNTKNMHKYICPLKSPAGFAQCVHRSGFPGLKCLLFLKPFWSA